MVVTLPLPSQVVKYFPFEMVQYLQWFAFWSFAGLLIIPWLFCVYQLTTKSVGRTRRIKHVLDEESAPKVVIIMPCYKEIPRILLRTVNSLVDCEYPPSCLHIFLSFDGDQEDDLYLNTLEQLGVPLTLESYPKSIDITYRSTRITVSRFPHGGKRHCQKRSFRLIDKIYAEYLKRNDNLFVLFIDSDCILDKACIQNFMYEMELKPGSKRNMLAMTGVITSTTEKAQPHHCPAGHGVHPRSAFRAVCGVWLWSCDLSTRSTDYAAILGLSKNGQVLLCRQGGAV